MRSGPEIDNLRWLRKRIFIGSLFNGEKAKEMKKHFEFHLSSKPFEVFPFSSKNREAVVVVVVVSGGGGVGGDDIVA